VYPEFGLAMGKLARLAKHVIDHPAPDPAALDPRELVRLLRLSRVMAELDLDQRYLQFKLLTMSAVDFLDQWFESGVLKAPMSVSGIIGTFLGVRSPGTAYVLLHHYMGEIDGPSVRGDSLLPSAGDRRRGAQGAESGGAPVSHIVVKERARGVVLSGEGRPTRWSRTPIRATFSLRWGHFDTGCVADPSATSTGKLGQGERRSTDCPTSRAGPATACTSRGDIAIAPSIDYLERAFDRPSLGASQAAYLNVVIPSLVDPSVAPPKRHVIFVQYAMPRGAHTWPQRREIRHTVVDRAPCPVSGVDSPPVVTPWTWAEMGLARKYFQGETSSNNCSSAARGGVPVPHAGEAFVCVVQARVRAAAWARGRLCPALLEGEVWPAKRVVIGEKKPQRSRHHSAKAGRRVLVVDGATSWAACARVKSSPRLPHRRPPATPAAAGRSTRPAAAQSRIGPVAC
jgi:hypothetical protein